MKEWNFRQIRLCEGGSIRSAIIGCKCGNRFIRTIGKDQQACLPCLNGNERAISILQNRFNKTSRRWSYTL